MTYQEGTNGIPVPVEKALTKAKDWYDEGRSIDAANEDRQAKHDDEAATLLTNIVLAVETTWGWR